MKRKSLSILIVLVLVLSFSLFAALPAAAASIQVNPGESIQAAIDAASPGDTINVAAGTYYENLQITKALNLVGAGADVTHVIASTATYTLDIDGNFSPSTIGDVLIQGFSFEDTDSMFWMIIKSDHFPANKTLTFKDNIVANGGGYGWWDYHSHGNLILTGCVFSNLWDGIQLEGWDTGDVTISNNEFVGFHFYTEDGTVYPDYAPGGINPFTYNLDCTNKYLISNNYIHDFVDHGYGIPVNGGYPGQVPAQYTNLEITGNTIENVGVAGIRLKNYAPAGQEAEGGIVDGLITNNSISGCATGILLVGPNPGTEIHLNNIFDNDLGLDNQSDVTVDATDNWWGHASGPGGPDGRLNPKGHVIGKGNGISGPAIWDPYLPQPINHTKHDPVPPGLMK